MKKTKLLTSLAALALVVSLGACQESSKEEDKETDPSDVLTLVKERGAATESWNGVEAYSYTIVDLYPDDFEFDLGALGIVDEGTIGSYAAYSYAQAVNTETGLDALYHYVYTDGENSRHNDFYFDGVDSYLCFDDVITYHEGTAKDYDISLFTYNLTNLLENEEDDGMLALLGQYVALGISDSAYTVEGVIEEDSKGATSIGFYVVCSGAKGTAPSGKGYTSLGSISLEIDYDATGDISHFYYEAFEYTVYDDASQYAVMAQVIDYAPYEGEVTAPEWLDDYEAGTGDDE